MSDTTIDLEFLEERLRVLESIVAYANSGVLVARLDDNDPFESKIVFVNPAFTQQTGYTAADVAGKPVRILYGPGADRDTLQEIVDGVRAKRPGRREVPTYRKDGSAFWTETTVLPLIDEVGNCNYILSIRRDITERKQAVTALTESEAKYRTLFETMLEGVIYQDSQARILSANPAAESILGCTLEEMRGKTTVELGWNVSSEDGAPLAPEERPSAVALASRKEVRNRLVEFFNPRLQERRWLSVNSVPQFREGEKRPYQVYNTFQDVTEQRRVEHELRKSHNRLRQLAAHVESVREEERTRIAREIHDELGQMLTVLRMELEGVAAKIGPPVGGTGEVRERLEEMVRHVDTSIESVRKIASELRPAVLDHLGLGAAVEWQVKEFQSRTGIPCRIEALSQDLGVSAHLSTGVFRIFQELLTNIARHAKATEVTVRLTTDMRNLTLTVRDNGKGIEMRNLGSAGSLGLLGMRERALLLGGGIAFSGKKGKGTAATLRIPIGGVQSSGTPAKNENLDSSLLARCYARAKSALWGA